MASAAAGAPRLTPWERLRSILGGSAGNFVEWFDWFSYASFAIYFSAAIFPSDDQTTQLLKGYLPFALGFVARPVGAFLMGVYADRAGRRAALSLAVSLMCAGSLAIALIPTGPGMGLTGALILTTARIAQGLSVGGEYGASATYVSEMASRANRGFWSGFLYVTIIAGQLAAVMVLVVLQHLLTDAQLYAWGWRVPFVIGAAFAVVVVWIRLRMQESPSFTPEAKPDRGRMMLLFSRYPKESAMIFVLTAAGGSGFYFYTSYLKDFLVNSAAGPTGHGFTKDQAALIVTTLLVVFMILQPLVGALSDRVGRRAILLGGYGLSAVVAFPIISLIRDATSGLEVFLLALAPLLGLTAYTSISAIVKAELFPAHVRALGVAAPYAIAQALFGGNVGALALALKKAGVEAVMFGLIGVLFAAGFVVAIKIRETQRHSLILEE